MRRHILAGAFLAVLTTLIVLLSDALGLGAQGVALLGAALGGALGLVPDRSPLQRVGAFAVGFAAAWLGYLLRAAVLPDAAAGRAVAVLIVLTVCLVVAGATRGRLPLWAMLLGCAAIAGAYEAAYALDPSAVLASSPAAATSVLVACGAGFLATALLGPGVERDRAEERAAQHSWGRPAQEPAGGVDALVGSPLNGAQHAAPTYRDAAPAGTRSLDTTPEA